MIVTEGLIRPKIEWGVRVGDKVIGDVTWVCAADVMRSAHGFGSGPYCVVIRKNGGPWEDFWPKGFTSSEM